MSAEPMQWSPVYGDPILRQDIEDIKQSPHAGELVGLLPLSRQLDKLHHQHQQKSSKRSPSPQRPSANRRSRSRSRTPRAYEKGGGDMDEDKDKDEDMDIDADKDKYKNKNQDANKDGQTETDPESDVERKQSPGTYSMRVAGLIAKTIKNWVRKARARDNETTVRNMYYKIMMELIFSKSNPINYFFSLIDNVKILPKDSASDSICFTGSIRPRAGLPKGLHVFVKLTRSYNQSDKFKEIEPRIYKESINPLIQYRLTPHLMMYLGSKHVRNWEQVFDQSKQYPVSIKLSEEYEDIFGPFSQQGTRRGGDLLITECGNGITLLKFLDKYSQVHQDELVKLLFQIIYTLHVMDNYEITHYDLHLGNVFLEQLGAQRDQTPQTFIYFLNDNTYVVLQMGEYFARLFDWDMAYQKDVIKKVEEDSRRKYWACKDAGICNAHKSQYDFHKLFMLIYKYYKVKLDRSLLEFIKDQYGNLGSKDLNENLFLRESACGDPAQPHCRADSLCEIKQVGPLNLCTGNWTIRPNAMNDSYSILLDFARRFQSDSTFQVFHVDEQGFDPQYVPGTFKWINYVFASDPQILEDARGQIVELQKLKKLNVNKFL